MRRRSLLAALAILPVTACGQSGQSEVDGSGTTGFEAGDGSVVIVAADKRVAAPVLAGETLDGDAFTTADHAGKVIVVNVWGSWCAPCRAEAPELVEVAEANPDVVFVGIDSRDLDPAPAKAFVRAFEIDYPNLYDPDGSLLLGFGQLPPKAIPSTLVIDGEGRVAARIIGATTRATLTGVLEDVAT